MAVVNLQIGAGDATLAGSTVRAVAVDYRLLPVALARADGSRLDRPMEQRLGAGDQLVAFVALPDIERLLRREPAPAEWAVEVLSFPLPTRGWVAQLLRRERGLSAEDAERALDAPPALAGARLTRGQAEDVMALLVRERVTARLAKDKGPSST